jgi:hypothetical protein
MPSPRRHVALLLPLLALLLAATGCYRTTPPGPITAGGQFEGAAYVYYRWEQGLRIMIWHDATNATSSGSGSTSDPVYRVEGRALYDDGSELSWTIETRDGQTAQLTLNGVVYDLSAGTLFLVRQSGGSIQVEQLRRDLSGVEANEESILAFAQDDAQVARFIEEAGQ